MSLIPVLISLLWIAQAPDNEANELQTRVSTTRIVLGKNIDRKVQLIEKPLFRYSDELRQIEDAGIWMWLDKGRPAAVLKVERYKKGRFAVPWLYCFASLSPELVRAEWADAQPYQAKQPGVKWQPIADEPAKTRSTRLIQMRDIARRFSAEMIRDEAGVEKHQMRLLTTPLYRCDETSEILDGAVFGFTGTGTNPDVLLLIDLPTTGGWRYGITGMTSDGVTVRLGQTVAIEIPFTSGKGNVFETWCNFHPRM